MIEVLSGIIVFLSVVLASSVVVLLARNLLLPSHAVSVVVNNERSLCGRSGQRLLDLLLDAGIQVPSACAGVGTCGLCRVTVSAGGGEPLPVEVARLSRPDIRAGLRLACQVTMRADLEVVVPDDLLRAEVFECEVIAARTLSPLIREIVLNVPAGRPFRHRAGAFVQVTAPAYRLDFADIEVDTEYRSAWDRLGLGRVSCESRKPVTRAYSIASLPADEGHIVLFVRLAVPPPRLPDVPPGIVSSYLFGLRVGDKLTVSGPYGTFGATDSDREMIIIGGGVGMAPLRAIIYDQLERLATQRKISFWYGARSRIDLFHTEGLEALAAKHDNFSMTVALSDPAPQDNWSGPDGFIHTVVRAYLAKHPAPEACEYYLCGPPLMIQAVMAMLDEFGVEDTAIFFDDFGS